MISAVGMTGRIQAGVTRLLMARILMQDGKPAEALPHIQEAVTIFEETGSRHLPEAQATLERIQEHISQERKI